MHRPYAIKKNTLRDRTVFFFDASGTSGLFIGRTVAIILSKTHHLRVEQQFLAGGHVQLLIDTLVMRFDRVHADIELIGDVRRGEALHIEVENRTFGLAEQFNVSRKGFEVEMRRILGRTVLLFLAAEVHDKVIDFRNFGALRVAAGKGVDTVEDRIDIPAAYAVAKEIRGHKKADKKATKAKKGAK